MTVGEAQDLVMSNACDYGNEEVALVNAIGLCLAEDVIADRDFPPFDRISMDGIAIDSKQYMLGQRVFASSGIAAAGTPQLTLTDVTSCIEVMTGAILPVGVDSVIRYEDTSLVDDKFVIIDGLKMQVNVHAKGGDHQEGAVLLRKGKRLHAVDINILATVGKSSVLVRKTPKIVFISTGDELIPITETPLPHQIRMSNAHMLQARASQYGITATTMHLKDNREAIEKGLIEAMSNADALILSGGVSAGKFDFVPEVLQALGVEKLFHKITQRPGKPMWFGRKGEKVVFALPGNPISTLVCFQKYFIPWYHKASGMSPAPPLMVKLKRDVPFLPDLTYFAQASLTVDVHGTWWADVVMGNGSGDVTNPRNMDGFVELPRGKDLYRQGELYSFVPFLPIIY